METRSTLDMMRLSTQSPNTNYFVDLLEEGVITVDFAMHFRKNGSARDHVAI